MPLGGAIALGVGSLGSAVIGGINAGKQQDQATAARQAALEQYLSVNVPDPAQQKLILEKYQMTGQLDPAMEQAINAGPSAQQSIALDPTTRAAQISALSRLSDISANQGMDSQEKNQIQQGINQVNTNEKGQTGAILQNAATRGVGGSGASLDAELESAQAGANNAASNTMNAQAMASQRALSAMGQQAAIGGSVHSQDYGQALNAANATDAINQFNARNQNSAMQANTQARNQAQAYNVQEGQNIANQNTGLSNYQQQYNTGLQQRQFDNQMSLASGKANAEAGVANQYNNNATNTANQWGNISGALGTAAGAVYKNSQPKQAATTNNYYGASPQPVSYNPNGNDNQELA
ncbi:MAG: hypothetical protein NVS3B3_05920 [Aquirhabdus sp.]